MKEIYASLGSVQRVQSFTKITSGNNFVWSFLIFILCSFALIDLSDQYEILFCYQTFFLREWIFIVKLRDACE